MIGEDSGDEEDCDLSTGVTKPSRTSRAQQTRRSKTPDVHSAAEDDTEVTSVPASKGRTMSVIAAPASLGSALRKNADGSVATPKILPKRNQGSKVNGPYHTFLLANLRVIFSLEVGSEE